MALKTADYSRVDVIMWCLIWYLFGLPLSL